MSTPLRAASYLRLSEAQRGNNGESETIDGQRHTCKTYATNHGWNLTREYVDDDRKASVGSKPRPGFEALLAALQAGEVDGVIVRDTDRLQRNPEDLGRLMTTLITKRVPVLADNSVVDVTSPSGYLQFHMISGLGHFENALKSKRMKDQAANAARNGIHYMKFRPFGWTSYKMTEHEPREAEAIRLGVAMLAQFGKYSLTDVAKKWNEQGLTTPRTKKPWNNGSVYATITRPAIGGILLFKGEVLDVTPQFHGIVSREAYENMIASLKANGLGGGMPKGTAIVRSSVRGLVQCGRCGGNLARHAATYKCVNYPATCKGIYIQATKLEDFIYSYVAGRIALMPSSANHLDDSFTRLANLTQTLQTIAAERDELAQATVSMTAKLALMKHLDTREADAKAHLDKLRSGSALVGLVYDLKPLGKAMSFQAHRENKQIVLERMRELSPTQLHTLCGTFGRYTVLPGRVKERIQVTELDPFDNYLEHPTLSETL